MTRLSNNSLFNSSSVKVNVSFLHLHFSLLCLLFANQVFSPSITVVKFPYSTGTNTSESIALFSLNIEVSICLIMFHYCNKCSSSCSIFPCLLAIHTDVFSIVQITFDLSLLLVISTHRLFPILQHQSYLMMPNSHQGKYMSTWTICHQPLVAALSII
jgi:hypothetical protein